MNDPAHLERLGDEAAATGDTPCALQHYEAAISLSPAVGRLHAKAASAQAASKNYGAALDGYERALGLLPSSLAVLNNYGCVLAEVGRSAEAIAMLARAEALSPNYVQAPYNIGRIAEGLGQWDQAQNAYARVLVLEPSHQQALLGLSQIAAANNDENEAGRYLERALQFHPQSSDVHTSVALFGMRTGEIARGLEHARQAVALDPNSVSALTTFGSLASKLGYEADAQAAYQRALAIAPDHSEAWSAMLLSASYQSTRTPAEIYARHADFGKMLESRVTSRTPVSITPLRGRRIKLGYVSSDFRLHACATFLLPLLQNHDRHRFELILYSNNLSDDEITQRFKDVADSWCTIRHENDDTVAQRISNDAIDILIDCNGHTEGNRLPVFAQKPAPIAVTYLGLPTTTGLRTIDYRLIDPTGSPDSEGNDFDTERLVRLPNGYATYKPLCALPDVAPAPHLTNAYVTFGSFNNRSKLSRDTLRLWADILKAAPDSRLLFKDRSFVDRTAAADIIALFEAEGVASDRLLFRAHTDIFTNYLDYGRVDIALDPFPFNGYTTTCDALIMGVPVLALMGDRYMARVSASVLTQLHLTDLIASNQREYVTLAARLAADTNRLSHLRQQLRAMFLQSPLGDPKVVVADVERFYEAAARGTPLPFVT